MAKQQYIPEESKLLHERLRRNAIQRRIALFGESNALTDLFGDDSEHDEELAVYNLEEANRIGMKTIGLAAVTLIVLITAMLLSGSTVAISTAILVGAVSIISLLIGLYFIDRSVSLRNSFSWREITAILLMGTNLVSSLIYGFVIVSLVAIAS